MRTKPLVKAVLFALAEIRYGSIARGFELRLSEARGLVVVPAIG